VPAPRQAPHRSGDGGGGTPANSYSRGRVFGSAARIDTVGRRRGVLWRLRTDSLRISVSPEGHGGPVIADKSAHKEERKKQASSLKEKRAAKKAKKTSKSTSLIPPTGR
jgi:hypothetical protein